ncbi:oxygen-insensitive NADPH nitroreductase [Macrococcoides canis]|uniref:oxygen-insensitive NADPH nitroreductase n=1 Tax=Macrococcoides canis TaxID=1855823 RepID=UPI00207D3535|nr:oxygen-insensitive NADPH nitroreductase [Macrococcus canis]MCO4097252.1 oxygen-insensitive NADPH nitroreductase [Macrococcus canis]UTH08697.1 oxygen-insensitive NADPH nitroreductase [Macrococcus canis]
MDTINVILNHRSIRKFQQQALTAEQVKTLVTAAQRASTSTYLQSYSIIGITDREIKAKLRAVSGQSYVEENGHLFVFVVDYNRHHHLGEQFNAQVDDYFGTTESLLVGTVDASLAAQNMAIAAESMGLGICYIGSLRNDMQRVSELLKLPKYTYPLFGMVVGVPDQEGSQKERLPFDVVYHENEYQPFDYNAYKEYDAHVSEYYQERTNGTRNDTWSEQVIQMLKGKPRPEVHDVVQSKGFLKQ